jgi:hypothetical protein
MEGCSTSDKVRPRHRNNYSNDSLLQALSVKSTYYQTNPNYRSSQLEAKEAQLLQWEARLKKKQQEVPFHGGVTARWATHWVEAILQAAGGRE